MSETSGLEVLAGFVETLESLGIVYAIGGSMASSIYGHVRFTQDADVTIEPFEEKTDEFYESLKGDYYISREAMLEALRTKGSFNIIHIESAFKIDIFICKTEPFYRQVIARRKMMKLDESVQKEFYVVSVEDIILLKLIWYREGGFSSEQQFKDVLGVVQVQEEKMDFDYLRAWSERLGVTDLLSKLLG